MFDQRARILVVDHHPVVREGLAARIAVEPDLEMCGEAADLTEALQLVSATNPDVVVLDIGLKSGSGIQLIKQIRAQGNTVRVLVWSLHGDNLYAERALRAGAMGYISKEKSTNLIIEAIRRVVEGKRYISDEVAETIVSRAVGGKNSAQSPVEALSDRELEVFQFTGQGRTTHEIAEKMRISNKTVETYRARIKEKLGLRNATELVQHATRWVIEHQDSFVASTETVLD